MARQAPSLEETRDAAIVKLHSLEKQSREGRIRGFFQIPRFLEDTELCPVFVLNVYYSKVKVPVLRFSLITHFFPYRCLRSVVTRRRFFISNIKPHKSITTKTLARWMKTVLTNLGVDPKLWAPHAVRAASSSHLSSVHDLDLGQICRLADWSMASSTYLKFYKRYV